MEPGSDEYIASYNITRKEYDAWITSRETYDSQLREQIIDPYDYKSPEDPGTLPDETVHNKKTYVRIKDCHGATCDNKACQDRFQMEDKLMTGLHAFYYPSLPIYTCNYEHELCALCLGVGKS